MNEFNIKPELTMRKRYVSLYNRSALEIVTLVSDAILKLSEEYKISKEEIKIDLLEEDDSINVFGYSLQTEEELESRLNHLRMLRDINTNEYKKYLENLGYTVIEPS